MTLPKAISRLILSTLAVASYLALIVTLTRPDEPQVWGWFVLAAILTVVTIWVLP